MLVEARLPHARAGHGIDCMDTSTLVAEEQRIGVLIDTDGRAHRGAGVVGPVCAAGGGIERVDIAVGAANKEASIHDRRLRCRSLSVGIAEGPLELQPRYLVGRQLCLLVRLEAMLVYIVTPAGPVRRAKRGGVRLLLPRALRIHRNGWLRRR